MGLFRSYEYLLIGYFTYTAVLSVVLPVDRSITWVTLTVNASVVSGLCLLAGVDALRRTRLLSIMRDWYPAPLLLLAYREMGWFALPHGSTHLERAWVLWDKRLLNEWGLRAAIESLGALGPSVLEISYSLVYAVGPFALAMLYVYGRRERAERFLLVFVFGALSSYALFPFFPSEPPRTVFPGEDAPAIDTVFRQFNWWLLGGYGIHTSVFPSGHVSASFAAGFGMLLALPERRRIGAGLLILATLIALATVYGRYHYAVDALAGFALSLLAAALGRWWPRPER